MLVCLNNALNNAALGSAASYKCNIPMLLLARNSKNLSLGSQSKLVSAKKMFKPVLKLSVVFK